MIVRCGSARERVLLTRHRLAQEDASSRRVA
jgi:hypothetical protein